MSMFATGVVVGAFLMYLWVRWLSRRAARELAMARRIADDIAKMPLQLHGCEHRWWCYVTPDGYEHKRCTECGIEHRYPR
jgi:hypothetical protein